MSHPDLDHFNLIEKLFTGNACRLSSQNDSHASVILSDGTRFTGSLVLTEAFMHKNIGLSKTLLQQLRKKLGFGAVVIAGEKVSGSHELIRMAKCFELYFPLSNLGCKCLVCKRGEPDTPNKEIKRNKAGKRIKDWNESSTIVNVGNAAILTGDATAKTLQPHLLNQTKLLHVFQVPHHGSKRQYYQGNISINWKYLLAFRALVNFYMGGVFDLVRHMPYVARMEVLERYEHYFPWLHLDLDSILTDRWDEIQFDDMCRKLDEVWVDLWNLDLPSDDKNQPKAVELVKDYKHVKCVLRDKYHKHKHHKRVRHGNKRAHLQPRVDEIEKELPADLECLFRRLEMEQWKTVIYTKATAEFYKKVPAKVYVISSGLKHYHPDEEVLSGIALSVHNIMAATNSIIPVTLLVTSYISLQDKILHFPPDFKIDENSKFLKVEYLTGSHIPSIPIDLTKDGDLLSECRRDNYLKTWPWNSSTKGEQFPYAKETMKGEIEVIQSSGAEGGICEDEDPSLSEYLKVVAPSLVNKPEFTNLSSVLKLLVGPELERQLSLSGPSCKGHLEKHNLLQDILKLDVMEESEFLLSGATKHQSAKSAKLSLHLPPSNTVKVMGMTVRDVTVQVENAMCPNTTLKVGFNFAHDEGGVQGTLTLDYSELCKSSSSVGRPLTTLLSDIGSQSKASDFSVGTLLGLTLGAVNAEFVIHSFPIKVSSYLATWKLNLPQTVIDFESEDDLLYVQGAFIVGAQPSQLCPILLSPTLQVEFTSMEMKLALTLSHATDGMELRGDCIVNSKDRAVYRSSSSSLHGSSKVEIEFTDRLLPSDLLVFFSNSSTMGSTNHGSHIKALGKQLEWCTVVSSGLIVEQPATYYSDTRIVSTFFNLDPRPLESDVMHLLPEHLQKWLKLRAVRAVCMRPPDFSLLGIESVFTSETLKHTELKLQILPLIDDTVEEVQSPHRLGGNSYHLTLRPIPTPYSSSEEGGLTVGPSVLAVVKTLCPECNLKDVLLSSFPMIKSILDSIQIRYFYTEINPSIHPLSISCFELNFSISSLEIMPEKLTIESADIDLFFSKDRISISSHGRITVLKEHTCIVSFSLPVQDRDGRFSITNYSNALTLLRVMEGFGLAESQTVSEIPIVSTVLGITIKSISMSVSHDYTITKAGLTIYKSQIEIGDVTLSEVELTVLYSKESSLSFLVQGFVGKSLFATLSYDHADRMLSGSITTSNILGERVKLSSFMSFIGLPSLDVPSKLKETFRFMDLEVVSASICLKLSTPVGIESLQLRLRSDSSTSLELMADPKIVLQDVELEVEYVRESRLSVLVRGSITIANVVVILEGEVNEEGMTLKGKVEQPSDFIKAIEALKPSQSHSLAIPEFSDNVHGKLSVMHSVEFLYRVQNDRTDIMVACESSLETSIDLGGHKLTLESLGAKVCVTIHKMLPVQYSGYVGGSLSVSNFQVEARLALVPAEKNVDIVFVGECRNVESLSLKMLSNTIEKTPGTAEQQQQLPPASGSNLPNRISDVTVENIVLAANVTQKQLFFFLKLKEVGSGLVMLSRKKSGSEYILGLSLPHGYRLQQISDILAPIDKVLLVRELHFLVVAMDSECLSDIITTFHKVAKDSDGLKGAVDSFEEAQGCSQAIKNFQSSPPLASIHPSDTKYVRETQLKRGFYIYCKLDLVALNESDSIFRDVVQLSENDFPDIMLSMFVGKEGFESKEKESREISISAYIPRISLFGEITFSDVSLEYHLAKEAEVTLSGNLTVELGESNITIGGSMHVSKKSIEFSASKCMDTFSSPLGVTGATLQNISCDLKIEKEKQRMIYEIALTGSVKFSDPSLTFDASVIFKDGQPILLAMTIEGVLKLTNLVSAVFGFKGSKKSFLEINFRDGHLVYARQPHKYKGFDVQEGLNAMSTLVVMKRDFKITAIFITKPELEFTIKGSLVGGAINILGLVELTNPDFSGDSVVLGCSYKRSQGFKLFLLAGVVLLGKNLFRTEVSYNTSQGVFEGEVKCAIKYIADMTITFRWSKHDGFEIVKWPAMGDFPVEKVLKTFEFLYDIVSLIAAFATGGLSAVVMFLAKYILKKCLKFTFEMDAKLNENPDPSRYRVAIGLKLIFVIKLIGKDIFRKDIIEIEVKMHKDDTLKDLPERIWDAFVEWFKETFSSVFSKPSEDDISLPTDYLPDMVSSLSQFDKHFERMTRVVHNMTVIHLGIKSIGPKSIEQRRREKLKLLLGKHEKWLNDHKKFIDIPCILKALPVVVLAAEEGSPVKLHATWHPPLEDDCQRYSYDVRIKTVDSADTTEIVNTKISKAFYECDDPKIAEATLISFEIRCIVTLSARMQCGDKTISSDEDYTLEGQWSEVTVLNFKDETEQLTEPDAKPDPPQKVTVELTTTEGKHFITGNIHLSNVPHNSVITIQLLNGDSVLPSQPANLSVTKGLEHTFHFGFDAEEIPLDAQGPFSVQAQVLTCVEGKYKQSDMTRSESSVTRVKSPQWTKFQYDTKKDRVFAEIKTFDKESQCMVELTKDNSTALKITPVDRHLSDEGDLCSSFDGSDIRSQIPSQSHQPRIPSGHQISTYQPHTTLTCSAQMKGTKTKLCSCPSLSTRIRLLPPPTGFKCLERTQSHRLTVTQCDSLEFEWDPPQGVTLCCVGLMDVSTSRILQLQYAKNGSCTVHVGGKQAVTFKCFVFSFGNERNMNSERVFLDRVFIHVPQPSIRQIDFNKSAGTLALDFKGDSRASYFLAKYTLSYHLSHPISATKKLEHVQRQDNHNQHHRCLIDFEREMLRGCRSIRVSVQAVGEGSLISSQCDGVEGEDCTVVVMSKLLCEM